VLTWFDPVHAGLGPAQALRGRAMEIPYDGGLYLGGCGIEYRRGSLQLSAGNHASLPAVRIVSGATLVRPVPQSELEQQTRKKYLADEDDPDARRNIRERHLHRRTNRQPTLGAGTVDVQMPRGRLVTPDGGQRE
jgi:hypothetical protein